MTDLAQAHDAVDAEYLRRSADNPMLFIKGLKIPSGRGPKPFFRCMEDFQVECFEEVCPSLVALRDGVMPPCRRFWIERTKKASKDADLAAMVIWLCAFAKRPFYGQIGAVDRGQAHIIKERIDFLLDYNPWLNEYIELVSWEIRSLVANCRFDIMARDIAGAHGGIPDMLIVNELSHIAAWEFFETLMDNADGVPQGMVIVATNAGFQGSKAFVMREDARNNPTWKTFIYDRPAPWHNEESLSDAQRRNTPSRFRRLWRGEWVSGKGDALDDRAIQRCFSADGPMDPAIYIEQGWRFIAGLDLGVSHDHSALMILGVNVMMQQIRTAWWRYWTPREDTGEVDLIDVENTCRTIGSAYRVEWFGYDPSQAKLMAQRMESSLPMVQVSFTAGACTAMAESLIQVVNNSKFVAYDDEAKRLQSDIGKFSIVEKGASNYKLDAVSDETGHADVGTALVIALPTALEMLGSTGQGWSADSVIFDESALGPISKEEMDDMPDDLKDIIEASESQKFSNRRNDFSDAFLEPPRNPKLDDWFSG